MEEKSAFDSFELDVNKEIRGYLEETSKWSYFLAILGFVGVGIMVLVGIGMSFYTGLNELGGDTAYGLGYSTGMSFIYLLLALIYFFPLLYLLKFSKKMKSALKLNNDKDFKMAFLNLKSHYKFMGIFAIVVVSIYVLAFVIAMLTAGLF
ncbi:DUF5362 family protein [Flavivirga algicola]|uniref:DUF5362 domain-containing protein n=1 Tax=Flavivirga algicola TaxID=2729136 RepID=A0ABX1RTI5_9FLAO|nr:DUF5362 family protein [Flavivirga algicola]NMH86083.1 hypothetical protein [Flavivirga algicola]